MARIDKEPDERDKELLKLDSLIDCPNCGTTFEWVFAAQEGIYEAEDLVDAPEDDVKCPNCDEVFHASWEGWHAHEDAG